MQAVYGVVDGPVPSAIWRIAGYVHAGLGRAEAWPSKDGYNAEPDRPISKTSRVVVSKVAARGSGRLRNAGSSNRHAADLLRHRRRACDVLDEAEGAVSTVMDEQHRGGGSQRSAASAATTVLVLNPHSFDAASAAGGA
ncbi:hypothetical protein [Pseudomonas aeruginosa]|uniref:hypothetical protein n=1 Tax=Pseudomonas aeruginosa TaxID=287 RepID=UPI0021B46696|nr:hypothetical protein [Pseudomonas aeruginosa]MCT7418578.1 hypothetical protein [Pseudomonas aeruginosa]